MRHIYLLSLALFAAGLLAASCSRAGAQAAFGDPHDHPPDGGYELVQGLGLPVDLIDFLPPEPATDGSVDYTAEVQNAIDAAAGRTLRLPDFPILVSRSGTDNWCLRITEPMTISGSPTSVLRESVGAVQILRAEGVSHLRLIGFALEGNGQPGVGLDWGILQVTGGNDILIDGVTARGSDADGIVVANAWDVRVVNCRSLGASKSGIYFAGCTDGVLSNNLVTCFGGHRTAGGSVVGAGVQLSSSKNVICQGNVITHGTGLGILCNANAGGVRPEGCVIDGNRIENVYNAANPGLSAGIYCANGNPNKATQTLVIGNSLRTCGRYGIFLQDHGGSSIVGNSVVESEGSGIVVGRIEELRVSDNLILNSDVSGIGQQAGVHLLSDARLVRVRGNVIRNSPLYDPAWGAETVLDQSLSGAQHDIEPEISHAAEPPTSRAHRLGDLVYNTQPAPGGYLGWVCTSAGAPGDWRPFGRIE